MQFKIHDIFYSQYAQQHVSAVITAIFRMMGAILVGTRFQPVLHTSPTSCIATHHITTSNITPHRD